MNGSKRFFFNEWRFLGRVDPALFESRRRNEIEDLCQGPMGPNFPVRKLQSEIDSAKTQANPENVLLELAKQLNERLNLLYEELNAMKDENKIKETSRVVSPD